MFRKEFERPNVNLEIKIAVAAPDGNFISYCGMWQDNASHRVAEMRSKALKKRFVFVD